jgi:hypothetical protein
VRLVRQRAQVSQEAHVVVNVRKGYDQGLAELRERGAVVGLLSFVGSTSVCEPSSMRAGENWATSVARLGRAHKDLNTERWRI